MGRSPPAVNNLAEHHVATVEVRGGYRGDEKLAPVGVFPGVCRGAASSHKLEFNKSSNFFIFFFNFKGALETEFLLIN